MAPSFVKLVLAFFGCLGFLEAIHSFPEIAAIAISIDKTADYLARGALFLHIGISLVYIGICLVFPVLIWRALHRLYARFTQSNIVDEVPNDLDVTGKATDPERLRTYHAGVARMYTVASAAFIFFSTQRLSDYLHDRKPATELRPAVWNLDLLVIYITYRNSCYILQRILGIPEFAEGAGEASSTRTSSSTIVEKGVDFSSESETEKGGISEKRTLGAAYVVA